MTKTPFNWVDWPAPANVKAIVTTRNEGCSLAPYTSNNLAFHVGDSKADVEQNRNQLSELTGVAQWQWLEQVHGTHIVTADPSQVPQADGAITQEPGLAVAVLTADCLPVLFCDSSGQQVAAVHAGWRGLAKGMLAEATKKFSCDVAQIIAYIGPAIGPSHFEVDEPVIKAFKNSPTFAAVDVLTAFEPRAHKPNHWLGNLHLLSRLQLTALGVTQVHGATQCTYELEDFYYSYRRDGITGRFATAIWRT